MERGRGEYGGKGTGNKKHKSPVQNTQEEVNSMGNREVKELMCMIHQHELRLGNDGGRGLQCSGEQRGEKMG